MAERYDSQDNHDVQILTEGFMVYMSDFMGQLMKIMAITQSDNNKWFDVYATMLQGIQKTVIGLVEEMVERKLKSAPAEIEKAMTVTVVTDTPVKITMSNNGAHVEVLKPENTSITGDSSDERSHNVTSMVEKKAMKIDKISSSEDEAIDGPTSGSFDMEIELGEKNGIVATVDTGAGVNVLPLNLYEESGLSGMRAMKALVRLADGSFARPLGIVEDVSMRVGGVEVKTNFVVMPASKYGLSDVVLLGRTFLNKLHMTIDMYRRTCTFEVDGKQHSL